jgi:hypothetical protein
MQQAGYTAPMLYLLSLLACPPSSDDSSPAVTATAKPFCTWEEGICTDNNTPMPLDGEIVQLLVCVDYQNGDSVCAPNAFWLYTDGTWEPQMCTLGRYYRACISY